MPASLAMTGGLQPARTILDIVKALHDEQSNLEMFKEELSRAKANVPKLPASVTQIPYTDVQQIKAAQDLVDTAQTAVEEQTNLVQSLEQEVATHLTPDIDIRISSGNSHIVVRENASSCYGLFRLNDHYQVVASEYETQLGSAIISARRAAGPDFSLAGPFTG
jgi:hypothetical protein